MAGDAAGDAPRKVFLFSGHMIDAPDRATPRFPAAKAPIAAAAIAAALDRLDAGPRDLAICGGASGGDLLFAEAALARGADLELYIPFDERTFLAESVDPAGADWHARYLAVRSRAAALHVLPLERDPGPAAESAYARNNRRMLEAASRFGTDRVEFIALWNGKGGDGPGGTQDLMDEVRRRSGRTHWLDTTALWS
jgi:hypothetical protein